MMASWSGTPDPTPILTKIYQDLHDIKLHLIPSYANKEKANIFFKEQERKALINAHKNGLIHIEQHPVFRDERNKRFPRDLEFVRNPDNRTKPIYCNFTNNYCYYINKGFRSWAGIFNPETKTLDNTISEPSKATDARSRKRKNRCNRTRKN